MKKLLMAGIAAAFALPALAGAHHQPGHQGGGGGGGNAVTINQPSPITWGKTTAINGTVLGQGNAGVEVELEADEFPYVDTEFARVTSATTDASGNYRFDGLKPELNTRYRVLARTSPPVTSVPATAGVRIKVTLELFYSGSGNRPGLQAEACPKHDGQATRFQRRRANGKWRTVKTAPQNPDLGGGPCSAVGIDVPRKRPGLYRAIVPDPAGHHLKGRSRAVRVPKKRPF